MWRRSMITIFSIVLVPIFSHCNGAWAVKAEDYAFYKAVRFGTVEEMEAILEAGHDPNYMNASGADPNLKYCLSPRLNPRVALEYYEKNGISAINCAIRFNLFSVVDLLLDNGVVLDEHSLEWAKIATERSGGNKEMEAKILALLDAL
ncbi:hypothetical protein FACS1894151_06730 [Spirochaetia bacterium]|nr:hypothetical protein FACS1894151_06730 [Spirochaetia bacterium]